MDGPASTASTATQRDIAARDYWFDADPLCPMTTSAHLPPGDNGAASSHVIICR